MVARYLIARAVRPGGGQAVDVFRRLAIFSSFTGSAGLDSMERGRVPAFLKKLDICEKDYIVVPYHTVHR